MNTKIAVIGLGYVGLPLAMAFATKYDVIGFDINPDRVGELKEGWDRTNEIAADDLNRAHRAIFTDDPSSLAQADVYIITTPTPVDKYKKPDLGPVLSATTTVARVLKHGDTVVYESTVYPGATEDECVPVLEAVSGLTYNADFCVGYSPERINPGDRHHRVTNIVKVTSGSNQAAARFIDDLYGSVIPAGTHLAPSIRVAEAAKVIENTQRDVNIALMNELAILFARLGIDTSDVLEAAGTKWNFLRFTPGLVGGHCIGVDPFYLTHKAQSVGHHPEIILAGRRLNDSMPGFVAAALAKELARRGVTLRGASVLVLGLAFKENTPDLRNTKVVDVVQELEDYGMEVSVYDPVVDAEEALSLYGISLLADVPSRTYDAAILAVAHAECLDLTNEARNLLRTGDGVIYDLKNCVPRDVADLRL